MKQRTMLLCAVLFSAASAFAAPRDLNTTGARHLWIEQDAPRNARATLVGRNVLLGGMTSSARHIPGGEVVWQKLREETDERGLRHVFYRQHVTLDGSGDSAELVGGEIAVHYDPQGNVYFINGAQFENFAIANARKVSRGGAQGAARAALMRHHSFAVESAADLTPAELDGREERTRLLLLSDGSGKRFRFAMATPVRDAEGMEYDVEIDADSGELIEATPNAFFSNCDVTNPTSQYAATGIPVRSDVYTQRSLTVSPATRAGGYQWEAYFNGDLFSPQILGQQVTNDTNFMCTVGGDSFSRTVFPVKADAVYDIDGVWQGRIMGDVMYKTRQAMGALASLGYHSFDNNNSRANISIQEPAGQFVNNMAFYYGAPDARKQQYSLVIGTTSNFPGS